MDNQLPQSLGDNRTGGKLDIKETMKTAEGAVTYTQPTEGSSMALGENRIRYMKESDPVGTMPMPSSIKGAISNLQEKIMQGDYTFMDKLGERLAFERTGSRLYEALLSKHKGSTGSEFYPDYSVLTQFYEEEKQHFRLCAEVMEELGGDSTAVTPCADVAGVAGMGWMQVIADPRTTFQQSLEIILQAELADNACWENLIELAENLGLDSVVERFTKAKLEEDVHLETVRQWVKELTLNGGKLITPELQ
ncbi:MAG TPA: ferritin-like domain-containing protein [Bacteriovoracaceae bacterium]|nr:ferritin-like domain-containing protein [Bacteriovoracaceae bacterium]